ncbi:MAG: hypothetical protein FJZ97_07380 [Chloroflexi bacterium]|nr:hypothetical protein [Chloroflexota bacterium]
MAYKPVSVEVYTSSHRILGRITPGAAGLFSFLNIPTTSYIEIEGAHLNRLHQPSRLVARYASVWIAKHQVVAILLSNRAEMGPTGMARGGYSTSAPHWVHILLGGYELRGMVETPGKFDFASLMFQSERLFVPIYIAKLFAILFPNVEAESSAMLFNRSMVDGMALLPRDEIPEQYRGAAGPGTSPLVPNLPSGSGGGTGPLKTG